MFQLDDAVDGWREGLMQQGTVGVLDMDELESHLRDDIERLSGQGLTMEEGFLVGIHRLGTTPELAAEYGKIQGSRIWARRLLWMLSGYVVISLTMVILSVGGQWVSAGAMVSGLVMSPGDHLVLKGTLLGLALTGVLLPAWTPWGRGFLMRLGDRVLSWGRSHPILLMVGAFFLYVGARTASLGCSLLVARLIGAKALGQEAYASAYFGLAMSLLLPAAILCLLAWTYRSLHRPTHI